MNIYNNDYMRMFMYREPFIGVYFIKNKINGHFYVGHSININKRFESHISGLRNNNHHSIYLQRAWNLYGEDNFVFIVYKLCKTEIESINLEQYFINTCINQGILYNISINAEFGGDLISNNPNKDEIIRKRSETVKQNNISLSKEELSERYGRVGEQNGMYGKSHSNETKLKISENNKGNIPITKGKKYEDYLDERRANELKRILSINASQRIGELNSFYGKHHSDEIKEKIRQSNLGKKPINIKKVIVGCREYDSLTDVSKRFNVVPATVLNRIRSKNYPQYRYE